MSNERVTAQQHLDYWVDVLRSVGDIPGEKSDERRRRQVDLRKIARSEVKRWAREARAEHRRLHKGSHSA